MGLYAKDEEKHWHLQWEWHAGLWALIPPGEDIDSDVEFFHERHEALEALDEKLRKQPVINFIEDDAAPADSPTMVELSVLPPREPSKPQHCPIPQDDVVPKRHIRGADKHPFMGMIMNPISGQKLTPRQERLAEYAERVGLQ